MSLHEQLNLDPALDGDLWLHCGSPGLHRQLHHHAELEFNLVIAGRARYLVDGQVYDLPRGTLVWLYREQSHLLIRESTNLRMWIAVFRPTMVRASCREVANQELNRPRPTQSFCRRVAASVLQSLNTRCHETESTRDHPDLYNAALRYLLHRAWQAHQQADLFVSYADVHPAVERAARLVRDRVAPISADELSEGVGLSVSQLSRLFHKQIGLTITQYRQRCCLDRFVQCYGKGQRRNITEAALAAGFGSYPQFHRVFTQRFGFGPAEYRRRLAQCEA